MAVQQRIFQEVDRAIPYLVGVQTIDLSQARGRGFIACDNPGSYWVHFLDFQGAGAWVPPSTFGWIWPLPQNRPANLRLRTDDVPPGYVADTSNQSADATLSVLADFPSISLGVQQVISTKSVAVSGLTVYNVQASPYSATGKGVLDDTNAEQAALNAARDAGGGIVYWPPGDYNTTTLTTYGNVQLWGGGGVGLTAAGNTVTINQIAGTANVILVCGSAASATSGVVVRDIAFTAFNNQASNTGGLDFTASLGNIFERVQVSYTNNFGFRVTGGNGAGDSMYNRWRDCEVANLQGATPAAFYLKSSTNSDPDGQSFDDCRVNGANLGWKIDKATSARGYGAESCTITVCKTIGVAHIFNSDGFNLRIAFNRFEVTGAGQTLDWTINNVGGTQPGAMLFANTYAAPGGFIANDNGAIPSPRAFENETGKGIHLQSGGGAPTITGVNAGISGAPLVAGTDTAFTVSFTTTGAAPGAFATLFTVNFSRAFPAAPKGIMITQQNASGPYSVYVAFNAAGANFQISNGSALANGTTYVLSVVVIM